MCEAITLVYEPFIKYRDYQYQVTIRTPLEKIEWMGDVLMTSWYANESFTWFELCSRFAFLLGTLGVSGFFLYFLRRYPLRSWTVEQHWAGVLLLGLICYNDPFFYFSVSVDAWFFVWLDQLLAVTFLALLFFFWLVMVDALRYADPAQRTWKGFYLPKIVLMSVFWLTAASVYIWIEVHVYNDPTYPSPTANPGFIFLLVLMVVEAVAYLAWIGYLLFSVFRTVRLLLFFCFLSLIWHTPQSSAIPSSSTRIKFFGLFTLGVIILTAAGILGGFLGSMQTTGIEFLAFIGLFNFYVWILAVMYLPAKPVTGTVGTTPSLEMVTLAGSDTENEFHSNVARELDFGSRSSDFEISLSDINMRSPSPNKNVAHAEFSDE